MYFRHARTLWDHSHALAMLDLLAQAFLALMLMSVDSSHTTAMLADLA